MRVRFNLCLIGAHTHHWIMYGKTLKNPRHECIHVLLLQYKSAVHICLGVYLVLRSFGSDAGEWNALTNEKTGMGKVHVVLWRSLCEILMLRRVMSIGAKTTCGWNFQSRELLHWLVLCIVLYMQTVDLRKRDTPDRWALLATKSLPACTHHGGEANRGGLLVQSARPFYWFWRRRFMT